MDELENIRKKEIRISVKSFVTIIVSVVVFVGGVYKIMDNINVKFIDIQNQIDNLKRSKDTTEVVDYIHYPLQKIKR